MFTRHLLKIVFRIKWNSVGVVSQKSTLADEHFENSLNNFTIPLKC